MNLHATPDFKVLTALMMAHPEKSYELSQALEPLHVDARELEGCLECMVGQDLGGQAVFLAYSVWRDLPALDSYLASDGFRILLGAANTLAHSVTIRVTSRNGQETTLDPTAPRLGS